MAKLLDLPKQDSEAAAAGSALLSSAAAAFKAGRPREMSRCLLKDLYQAITRLYKIKDLR